MIKFMLESFLCLIFKKYIYANSYVTVVASVFPLIIGGHEAQGQQHHYRYYSHAQGLCLPFKDNGIMLNCGDN